MIRTRRTGTRGMLAVFDNLGDMNTNAYLIFAETAVFIIDTGFGSDHGEWLRKQAEGSRRVIAVNSHHHWDHVGGNGAFRDCPIISHTKCREILDSEWEATWKKNLPYASGSVEKCLPNLTFTDEIRFPEDGITIFHSPGHTPDCISILDEKDRVLIAGDNIGDTMGEPVPHLDETASVYRRTLLDYLSLDFDLLISGHNEVLDKSFLKTILDNMEH